MFCQMKGLAVNHMGTAVETVTEFLFSFDPKRLSLAELVSV